MNFESCFKLLDLLGPKVTLYSRSSSTLKTNSGAILTLIIGIFSIVCFVGLGMDMILRRKPSLYEYRMFNLTSEIKLEKIPFAIGIMRPGGGVINELNRKLRIFFEYALTNSSNLIQPTKFVNYNLVPCKETTLFKQNINEIKSKIIGQEDRFFCLPEEFKESIVV
jgi:hypothetical protein